LKELVINKTAIINNVTESVLIKIASAKITVKTSGKMELFYMFYITGIFNEKGVNTELHEILFIKCEESNRFI
jgi:hypothetical protein